MRTRTLFGNHSDRYMITPGNNPASVTPRMNRRMMNIVSFVVKANSAATMPHVTAMRASQKRAPNRLSSRFDGISKIA